MKICPSKLGINPLNTYHPSLTQVGEIIIQTANTPIMGTAIMMVCLLVAKHSCLLHSATKKGLRGPREPVHHLQAY
jgi:hypothetical protein